MKAYDAMATDSLATMAILVKACKESAYHWAKLSWPKSKLTWTYFQSREVDYFELRRGFETVAKVELKDGRVTWRMCANNG